MGLGGRSRRRWPLGTSQLAKAGRSGTTARWPRSAPKKQQQPDAFTLQICGPGGVEALEIITTPLGCVPGGVFSFLAGAIFRTSGIDMVTDSLRAGCASRNVPEAEINASTRSARNVSLTPVNEDAYGP